MWSLFFHQFVVFFLHKVDHHGVLLSAVEDNLTNAVQETFCNTHFLTHTSVVLFHLWGSIAVVRELILSTKYRPWGYPLLPMHFVWKWLLISIIHFTPWEGCKI